MSGELVEDPNFKCVNPSVAHMSFRLRICIACGCAKLGAFGQICGCMDDGEAFAFCMHKIPEPAAVLLCK